MLQLPVLFKNERLGLIMCILVFLLGVLSYFNSYYAEFVFDDSEAIQKNLDVRVGNNAVPLFDLFFHDFWGTKLISNISHKSYRPLTVLTFR
jgi:protein O-mannosyl-transferase